MISLARLPDREKMGVGAAAPSFIIAPLKKEGIVYLRLLFRRRFFWLFVLLLVSLLAAGCAFQNTDEENGEGVAEGEGTTTPAPTPLVTPTALPVLQIPAACVPGTVAGTAGQAAYYNLPDGYCLLYPAAFQVGDVFGGRANFYGPALSEGLEPVQASASIVVEGAANGRTVAQLVEEMTAASVAAGATIARTPLIFGGVQAEMVDGLPGRYGTRQLYAIHNDTIYHAIFGPVDPAFPQAVPDVEAIWQSVAASFTFLPATFEAALSGCPLSGAATTRYLKLEDGYCLLYPASFRVGDVYPAVTSFYGQPMGVGVEPQRVGLTVLIEGNANGRPVVDVVEDKLGELLAQGIPLTDTEGTLGGEPAIVIEGVPGRFGTRQMYAIHNDLIFHVTVYPIDPALPQAAADVQSVWSLVTATFTFIDTAR
jgi:hypothetical protein